MSVIGPNPFGYVESNMTLTRQQDIINPSFSRFDRYAQIVELINDLLGLFSNVIYLHSLTTFWWKIYAMFSTIIISGEYPSRVDSEFSTDR